MILKKSILLLIFITQLLSAGGCFLLLMGPSGVGKSTLIAHLKHLDSRFVYISPYTTRPLRNGETDKVHSTIEGIEALDREGKILTINKLYDIYYATPKDSIDIALKEGRFPILDWPISKIDIMQQHYASCSCNVYIAPENKKELQRRLTLDGRDGDGKRYSAGVKEIDALYNGDYDTVIDIKVVNKANCSKETAQQIYEQFLIFQKENHDSSDTIQV